MLKKILPNFLFETINNFLDYNRLYEIRIRQNKPIVVNYNSKYYFLSKNGLSIYEKNTFISNDDIINSIINRATEFSLYAATKQINSGYITIEGGIRIGICGEVVWDNEHIRAVKNFNSINIRVPHEIKNCSDKIFEYIFDNCPLSTLIISQPGAGKTTMLRDIARKYTTLSNIFNVLILDERSEIAACNKGLPQLDVGLSTDILSNCNKKLGFEQGIRAMRPDIIICDEIANQDDISAIEYAISSGVVVVASVHAFDKEDFLNKKGFENIVKKHLFDRYVVLSSKNKVGELSCVYDNSFEKIN